MTTKNHDTTTDQSPHPLRTPCQRCGSVDGFLRQSGPHHSVSCAGCGSWQYHAPQHPPVQFVRWDLPKTIAGTYDGFELRSSQFSEEPRRLHRVLDAGRTMLVPGTSALDAMLVNHPIGQPVTIKYRGEVLTRRGYRFKKFTVHVTVKPLAGKATPAKRDGILNPSDDDEAIPF